MNYIEGDDVTQGGSQGESQGGIQDGTQGGSQDGSQGGIQGIPYPISSFTSTTTSPPRLSTFFTRSKEGGCLEPGEYRVVVAKCRSFARKMMFLEAVKKEASSSSDASSGVGCSPLPLPEICERCRLERKHHR